MSRRRWALLALTALAFGLRVGGLAFQSLWRDEVDAVRFASQPWPELLRFFTAPGQNGPLYYLLLKPWLGLAGSSEFALRFFSVICGVLAVPLVDAVARRLLPGGRWIGLVSALLVATSPYLVWYSQEGKMYAAVLLAALLSTYLLLEAIRRGGWSGWLFYALATTAAIYLHLVAALLVPAQVLIFLALGGWQRPKARLGYAAALAVLVLPYLPLAIWQLPLLARATQSGYPFVPLSAIVGSLLTSYIAGVAQDGAWWVLTPAAVLLVLGLSLAFERRWAASVGALAGWLVVPVLALFLFTLLRPIYTARYLIFVAPALILIFALGAVAVGRRAPALAGVLLLAVVVVNARGIWLQSRTQLKADFRAATCYIVARRQPQDLVIFQIPYGRYSFDYYLPSCPSSPAVPANRTPPSADSGGHQIFLPALAVGAPAVREADGLYTNAGVDPQEVDRQMNELVQGRRVVWLVSSEAEIWDWRGLVQGWLEDHGTPSVEVHLVGVAVYRYDFR